MVLQIRIQSCSALANLSLFGVGVGIGIGISFFIAKGLLRFDPNSDSDTRTREAD